MSADQQAAGLIMKLGGGFYLWTLITVMFFRWAHRHEEAERLGTTPSERDLLTWDEVEQRVRAARTRPTEGATPSGR